MIYCIDIDGTICTQELGEYKDAKPYMWRIAKINKLYDEGHTIIYFTARGTTTGIDWEKVTKEEFKKWGVKYHQLIFGKPNADFFVDDKSIKPEEFFDE